jgi:hypothetical protein
MKAKFIWISTAVLTAALAGVVGCGSTSPTDDRGSSTTTAQPLTDDECMHDANTTLPMYSGTHVGTGNGTVDLGNGQSASVFNSDGVSFDWSATTPIALMVIRGSTEGPGNIVTFNPAKKSGGPQSALKDAQGNPLPLTAIKFCYFFTTPTPPADAGTDTGTGGEGPDSGGSNNTDAGNDGGGNTGGGQTW